MAPTFFAQCAAGCLLVVGLSDMRSSGWKYLRLMALVSLGMAFLALMLIVWRDAPAGVDADVWRWYSNDGPSLRTLALSGLATSLACTILWLIFNAMQADAVRSTQRLWPLIAGIACAIAAAAFACRPDTGLPGSSLDQPLGGDALRAALATALGAMLLGGVTSGMLLGHRYLTDTDMPIAPLRRLTMIYLTVLALRLAWVAAMAWPLYGGDIHPTGGALWFWVVATVRGGVGLIGAAIFAWMIYDCVKVRATQSATAIFYLSMVFVFLGELAAQYLLRVEGLAV